MTPELKVHHTVHFQRLRFIRYTSVSTKFPEQRLFFRKYGNCGLVSKMKRVFPIAPYAMQSWIYCERYTPLRSNQYGAILPLAHGLKRTPGLLNTRCS